MAYDPSLPANNSPIVSAELRNQFAGLKALIDAQQAQINAILTAPTNIVLSYDGGPDSASWTYDGNRPAQWEPQFSQDSGATWQTATHIVGTNSDCAPDVEPAFMRIRALDANGSPISDFSNSVHVG